MADRSTPPSHSDKRPRVHRVVTACDLCKARKVKCNGEQPCSYCTSRKRAESCAFSACRARNTPRPAQVTPGRHVGRTEHTSPRSVRIRGLRDYEDGGYTVPLDGRLLRDVHGKNIFIGDCAPLSFLQTVRHLIASEIDPNEVNLPTTRDSVIEAAPVFSGSALAGRPYLTSYPLDELEDILVQYETVTSGLVDLFDQTQLFNDIKSGLHHSGDLAAQATYRLVLAIGLQDISEPTAESWFQQSREMLMNRLFSNMGVVTVQGFTLLAIYMLRAFQPNGAYLYFSLAARTAYAIGIHRSEVNASLGTSEGSLRNRLWKSLRCVDMLISSSLGRPPSTSDVDCTIIYFDEGQAETEGRLVDILDASTQMFMIIEQVIVQVYSRKRISLRIANYVSHQHKKWASRWLTPLTSALRDLSTGDALKIAACQTLCSYYYSIMLLSRPFLFYNLYEYLGSVASSRATVSHADHEEKRNFAAAALDAAVTLVEALSEPIENQSMPLRMPMVVSWLFAASLTLAIGVLGQEGYLFEKPCRDSIDCLQYFAKVDPHARQYSQITLAILTKALDHISDREQRLRKHRRHAASQLFGMLPSVASKPRPNIDVTNENMPSPAIEQRPSTAASDWTMYDGDFFALPWPTENDAALQDFLQPVRQGVDGTLADVPLFPLDDPMAFIFTSNTGVT